MFILLCVPFLGARCHGMPGASSPFDATYMASLIIIMDIIQVIKVGNKLCFEMH